MRGKTVRSHQPYFTPDVVDILTAYAVDYIVPIVALAQAIGRTALKDYDIGVTIREPPAHDGTAIVTIRVGAYRLERTLKYDLDAADKFFDNLSAFATMTACRAAGVFGDGEFMSHLTSPDAATLIASRPRTVQPANVHSLAAAMIRRHSVR